MTARIYPTFLRNDDQRHFEEKGFLIYTLHDQGLPDKLVTYIDSLQPDFGNSFYYSLMDFPPEKNKEIGRHISEMISPEIDQLCTAYTIRNSSFIAKPAGVQEEMFLHQDWSFTTVDRFATGTLWIPLCDTRNDNGALIILPGSHRLFKNYISGSIPTARIPSAAFATEDYQVLEIKKGQAVLFNPSVFHGSCPNLSQQLRIAVTTSIFPKNAPFIYYKRINEETIGAVDLPDDVFMEKLEQLAINDSFLENGTAIAYTEKESRDIVNQLPAYYRQTKSITG